MSLIVWAKANPWTAGFGAGFILYLLAIAIILIVLTRGASTDHKEPL